jgi:OmpA-OmpF porin, OOP family
MPILARVRDVAQELGPKNLRIEGHTDSMGSDSVNKTLSQSRAQTIADYFSRNGIDRAILETEGLSFSKPLATNKTKEGRAQNRRVDVIITPDGTIEY